ncbi:uncharacterized protein LOC105641439 [Jatropha curcas]|uniref:uncharacterized protein LOC105641439 n=1 Tax=Jatropha curcas TaxID=180498 RepID=UPI0005FB47EC|nr:uncharacterized protein LOC105641439 [Jatropha curcas]
MVLPKIIDWDFPPQLEWTVDQAGGSLLIHVADFQKDRIKVKVDNESMNVLVFGEQPTKQIRFKLTAYIPKTCNSNGVSAILCGGILYIRFLNLVDEKTMVMPEMVDVEFRPQCKWRVDQADSNVLIHVPGSMYHMGIYMAKEKGAIIASEVSSGAEKKP